MTRLCANHVAQLRSRLVAQGAGGILLPADQEPPPFDLDSGLVPDLLSIAVAHLLIRTLAYRLPVLMAERPGWCAACAMNIEHWFDASAAQAIELYMIHAPPGGHA